MAGEGFGNAVRAQEVGDLARGRQAALLNPQRDALGCAPEAHNHIASLKAKWNGKKERKNE